MRQPSTDGRALAWHTRIMAAIGEHACGRALKDIDLRAVTRKLFLEQPSLAPSMEVPEAGFYRTRLVRGGPYVPARIWVEGTVDHTGHLTGDEVFRCQIDGRDADPFEKWPWLLSEPITQQEFDFMAANAAWARQHAPGDPRASPGSKINWNDTPIPNFKARKARP